MTRFIVAIVVGLIVVGGGIASWLLLETKTPPAWKVTSNDPITIESQSGDTILRGRCDPLGVNFTIDNYHGHAVDNGDVPLQYAQPNRRLAFVVKRDSQSFEHWTDAHYVPPSWVINEPLPMTFMAELAQGDQLLIMSQRREIVGKFPGKAQAAYEAMKGCRK